MNKTIEKDEDFLSDVPKEGDNAFEAMETLPADSAPVESEDQEEEEVPAEVVEAEEAVPFHKHPRWIERETELNDLRESSEATARELDELRAMKEQPRTDSSSIPAWFTELYGDNQFAWQKYSEHEEQRTNEIESRILSKQQDEVRHQEAEAEKWTKWVDDEIANLEADGKEFDRNKLIKVMLDYSPTDENNNLSFEKGMGIYEAMEGQPDKANSKARKVLADTATATVPGEPVKKNYMTPAELRNRSWGSL